LIFGEPFETPFGLPPATIQYKTYSLDAIMALVPTILYEADALLQARDTKTYSVDAIMEDVGRVLYESDLLLAANNTQTYQMAGRVKSDIHLGFYVCDGAVALCNVRAKYRMGGLLVSANTRSWNTPKRRAFSAKQSLIVPDDINADDRFNLANRVAVEAKKKSALK